MRWINNSIATVAALAVACVTAVSARTSEPPEGREFEFAVRELVFSGLAGDVESLERALELCSRALAEDPENAEALVWHGSTSMALAGVAYQNGDLHVGGALWQRALEEMDRAVELAPDDVAVLIPRAATLLGAARNAPFPAQARSLTQTAVADYEKVYDIQRPYFDRMTEHARGELLLGLADGRHRLGDHEVATGYLRQIAELLPGSPYAREAEAYLAGGADMTMLSFRSCQGCHEGEIPASDP